MGFFIFIWGKKLQRPTIHCLLATLKMMAGILLLSSARASRSFSPTRGLFGSVGLFSRDTAALFFLPPSQFLLPATFGLWTHQVQCCSRPSRIQTDRPQKRVCLQPMLGLFSLYTRSLLTLLRTNNSISWAHLTLIRSLLTLIWFLLTLIRSFWTLIRSLSPVYQVSFDTVSH